MDLTFLSVLYRSFFVKGDGSISLFLTLKKSSVEIVSLLCLLLNEEDVFVEW